MYSGAHWGTLEDRSRQGSSRDTWLENKINARRSNFCCSPLYGIQGLKFVYILVGVTRECLNRQTAAGLPSQQLINNSPSLPFSLYISLIVPDMNNYLPKKWNKYNNHEPVLKIILFTFPGFILEALKWNWMDILNVFSPPIVQYQSLYQIRV